MPKTPSDTLSFALVLTSAPGCQSLTDAHRAAARAELAKFKVIENRWLAPSEAAEILFAAPDNLDTRALAARITAALGTAPIDVNIVPDDMNYRRKQLLIADMDSTIIEQECIDEMADVLGLKDKIAAITELAMRGELQFEDALRSRLALLKGISEADLQTVFETRLTLMPGARTLIATMKAHGAFTALVSGGFTFYTSRIATRVGFDVNHANTLGMSDGKLTGSVDGPILGREAKLANLQHYATARNLAPQLTMAVGDGANDLDMIRAAGLGVAYRAKPLVAAEAAASITHGDLTALLHLQGYTREQFVITNTDQS